MRFYRVILSACFVLVCAPAMGQMSITSTSEIDPNIRYGYTITYSLQGNPPNNGAITDVTWQYKMTSPCISAPSSPIDTGGTPSIIFVEGTPGTFVVTAKVTYRVGYTTDSIPVIKTYTVCGRSPL
jgi:hypothetical protein